MLYPREHTLYTRVKQTFKIMHGSGKGKGVWGEGGGGGMDLLSDRRT